jgi:subtilisin-like proprotein convertase family protein
MMGTSAEGEWRLNVMPLEGQNGGQLVKWRLTVVYQ